MLWPVLLLLQVTTPVVQPTRDDSAYASEALRALIATASVQSARVPRELLGYRAQLESEISVVLRNGGDKESALQIEQVESTLNWQRPNDVEQRVVGYRARSVTRNVSARTYFKRPWITPLMYGNRLPLLLSRGTGANALESAVHPFASDRDRYYRFSGGDTVEVLHSNGRSIPIVRIQVEPNMVSGVVPLLLRGEIDVDASRFQVVRMRGEFVRSGAHTALPVRAIPRGGRHDLHYAARLSRGVDRALADGH